MLRYGSSITFRAVARRAAFSTSSKRLNGSENGADKLVRLQETDALRASEDEGSLFDDLVYEGDIQYVPLDRPSNAPSTNLTSELRERGIAAPHAPPNVPKEQTTNYPKTWSESQNPRHLAMRGPRFEQMQMDLQPQPLSAMEMIQREPIRLTPKRIIECDGGDGALGHPRVFINLDKPGAKACPYCGIRFERSVEHHH